MTIAGWFSARAGAGVFALAVVAGAGSASAQDLSEKSVRSIMEYAWALTPQQFTLVSGNTVLVDKKKKDEVLIPVDIAAEVIKVGRLSAHAQVCELKEDQANNHESLMQREQKKAKWSAQQLVFINQLHLTTVMLLTGKIKLVEKDGDKEVTVHESKSIDPKSCSQEEKSKVKDLITAYVKSGPPISPQSATAVPGSAPTGGTPAAAGAAPAAAAGTAKPAAAADAGGQPQKK